MLSLDVVVDFVFDLVLAAAAAVVPVAVVVVIDKPIMCSGTKGIPLASQRHFNDTCNRSNKMLTKVIVKLFSDLFRARRSHFGGGMSCEAGSTKSMSLVMSDNLVL